MPQTRHLDRRRQEALPRIGVHQFLDVAWSNDEIAGEATFDIECENVASGEMLLPMAELRPKEIQEFEGDLEQAVRAAEILRAPPGFKDHEVIKVSRFGGTHVRASCRPQGPSSSERGAADGTAPVPPHLHFLIRSTVDSSSRSWERA